MFHRRQGQIGAGQQGDHAFLPGHTQCAQDRNVDEFGAVPGVLTPVFNAVFEQLLISHVEDEFARDGPVQENTDVGVAAWFRCFSFHDDPVGDGGGWGRDVVDQGVGGNAEFQRNGVPAGDFIADRGQAIQYTFARVQGLVNHGIGAALNGHVFRNGFHPVQRQARAHRDEKSRHGGAFFVADVDADRRPGLRIGLHQFIAFQRQLEFRHRHIGNIEAGRRHTVGIRHRGQETEVDQVFTGAGQAHRKMSFFTVYGGRLAIDLNGEQRGGGGDQRYHDFAVDQHLGFDRGVPDNGGTPN